MNKNIRALRDPEFRTDSDQTAMDETVGQAIEDNALSSITGGCNPGCGGGGGPSTRAFSCVPPNEACP